MQLISVNLGEERIFDNNTGKTGIYKFPAAGPVAITELGLVGDAVSDTKHHGGPDQAVYVYGAGDYAWWAEELGRDLPPGMFGENLTISELESAEFLAGDCLQVGAVTLQVTAPHRCGDLAARMEDPCLSSASARPGGPVCTAGCCKPVPFRLVTRSACKNGSVQPSP
ncbi:MAG: MOSC domain-containing protein, partial [Holophaga sp.]|nr:MOSC domain-containing protein [Holophaga sp.]